MNKKILLSKDYINNHKEEDRWVLSEFKLSEDLIQEDTIGKFQMYHFGELKISVYVKEGSIPHFHLEKSDKSFICCICLNNNYYFHHKGIKEMELSSRQKKDLYNFLQSINRNTGMSYYKTACIIWNSSEENSFKVPLDNKIPDYRKMSTSIHE